MLPQLGVWNKHGTCGFVSVGDQESSIDNASSSSPMIEVDSLDNVIGPTNTAVSFIKMDVEGAEYNALAGAAKVIQTYHPKSLFVPITGKMTFSDCLNLS